MAIVVAPAIGPTLGGWITDNYSWHWIFFINIPIGIVSLLATQRVVHDPAYLRNMARSALRVDYIGIGLIIVGVGFLQFVLDKGQENDWFASHIILVSFIIADRRLDRPRHSPTHGRQPHHGSPPAPETQFRHCHHLQFYPRHGSQWQHHPAPALSSERSRLHRATGRHGSFALAASLLP